jgi:hypothetical protein
MLSALVDQHLGSFVVVRRFDLLFASHADTPKSSKAAHKFGISAEPVSVRRDHKRNFRGIP